MWLCLLVKDVLQFSLLSVHLLKGKITDTRERDSHAGSFYYFFVKHESVGVGKKILFSLFPHGKDYWVRINPLAQAAIISVI